MATAYDIADRLIEHGDEVPDKESFVKKMSDPKFAEAVRTQLKDYGDEVPDSATFHGRYGASVPSSGFTYAKPEDYELLKRNLSEVGYSGLDDNQKELFKQQFSASKFAKAGGSFEDAVKFVDSQSENTLHPGTALTQEDIDKRNANTGDAYTLARNVLTTGLTPITAALEYGKDRLFNEGSWAAGDGDTYNEYQNKHMEAGSKGEGAVGFLGDPINVLAAKLPFTVGGTIGMGGLGAGQSLYKSFDESSKTGVPLDKTSVRDALISGGLAAGMHGALGAGKSFTDNTVLLPAREVVDNLKAHPSKVAKYYSDAYKAEQEHLANQSAISDISDRTDRIVRDLQQPHTETDAIVELGGGTRDQKWQRFLDWNEAEKIGSREKLDAVKEHMMETLPKYKDSEFSSIAQISDESAIDYFNKVSKDYVFPAKPSAVKGIDISSVLPNSAKKLFEATSRGNGLLAGMSKGITDNTLIPKMVVGVADKSHKLTNPLIVGLSGVNKSTVDTTKKKVIDYADETKSNIKHSLIEGLRN